MKKLVLIGVPLLLLVIGGGSYGYWHYKSAQVTTAVETIVSGLNALSDEELPVVSYETMVVKGFPWDIIVYLQSPELRLPVGEMADLVGDSELSDALPKDWVEEIRYEGVVVSSSLWSNNFLIQFQGDRISRSMIGDTVSSEIRSQAETPLTCQWSPHGLLSEVASLESLIRDTQQFQCSAAGLTMVDMTSADTLLSLNEGSIFLKSDGTLPIIDMRLVLDLEGLEISDAYDALIKEYQSKLSPQYLMDFVPEVIPYSALGKQDIAVDFSYRGPMPDSEGAKHKPWNVQLAKFRYHSDVFSRDMNFHLGYRPGKGFSIKTDGQATFASAYDDLKEQNILRFVNELANINRPDPELSFMRAMIRQVPKEERAHIIKTVLPRFSDMGNITFALEADGKTEGDFAALSELGLQQFSYETDHYGLTVVGDLVDPDGGGGNTTVGNFTATCLQCLNMLNRLSAYAQDLELLYIRYIDPEHLVFLEDAVVKAIKQFVLTVADVSADNITEPEAAAELVYTIHLDENDSITINERGVDELMILFSTVIMPHLPVHQEIPEEGARYEPEGEFPAADDGMDDPFIEFKETP